MTGKTRREGMALLTVLMLVAVMAAVCVALLDDVRFSVRRATNAEVQATSQAYAAGVEALAASQIARFSALNPSRTPIRPEWNGRSLSYPVEEGVVRATLSDGQSCFNINSLVLGQGEDLVERPLGLAQFRALGRALGLPDDRIAAAGDALIDWMDADSQARPGGAEDARYASRTTPYRTGGVFLAEVSEMRAVAGVDAGTYARLRPWLCALPTSSLSPLNPNTLTAAKAPLLVAVSQGRLSLTQAKAAIRSRPGAGWASTDQFWAQPALARLPVDDDTRGQITLATRYFDLSSEVDLDGAISVRTSLLERMPDGAVRTVIRRWTPAE